MRIGIFGGTFNPIHKGHIKAAELAKKEGKLDEVWFIPTYETPAKTFTIERASPSERHKMIKLAIKEFGHDWLKVKKYEISKKRISYTYKTIRKIRHKYKQDKLFFIMGSDRYKEITNWNNYNELKEELTGIIILNRWKDKVKPYSIFDIVVKTKTLDISSSLTLSKISWDNIPDSTREYIAKKRLYLKALAFHTLYSKRYQHSVSVASHAKRLAKKNLFLNTRLAYDAGIIHDVFKYVSIEEQKKIIKELKPKWNLPPDPTLHGYTAAAWLEKIYGIKNKNFLLSIKNHTIISNKMTKLDKIIYVADKVSSDRKGNEIGKLRILAYSNLNLTFIKIVKQNVAKLKKKGIEIKGETLNTYNTYILKKGKKDERIKEI